MSKPSTLAVARSRLSARCTSLVARGARSLTALCIGGAMANTFLAAKGVSVGKSKVDSVLYEQRDAIAADLVKSIQVQLDRLKAGIVIANVNVQNVQVPDSVQAAFNDAVKAGADRDRLKNEGQAYANDVIPKAKGTAARLIEEANGYRQRLIATAEGDASRFKQLQTEYAKAPEVTRQRLYLETMQQVYSNTSKVLIDAKGQGNLLYLPLDKLMQAAGGVVGTQSAVPVEPALSQSRAVPLPTEAPPQVEKAPAVDRSGAYSSTNPRDRDTLRGREREGRQ